MLTAESFDLKLNSAIRNPQSKIEKKEEKMPFVQISLIQGRTPEKKEALIKKVTEAIVETLQISKDQVHIVLNELPKENIGDGGIPLSKQDI
jgi:4-oxalocrotonate tautomerase